MADTDQKTSILGDIAPLPDTANDAPRRRTPAAPATGDDVRSNDEDTEPGGLRSDRPDRPSTADDQKNPRTGPIG
jgi:hypothetical protein